MAETGSAGMGYNVSEMARGRRFNRNGEYPNVIEAFRVISCYIEVYGKS
jgi:hypothetical protein